MPMIKVSNGVSEDLQVLSDRHGMTIDDFLELLLRLYSEDEAMCDLFCMATEDEEEKQWPS